MLSCSNIHFAYGSVQVLHDVSIEVPKAKVVCVMGRNGVGKTTLMRNIVGLEKASKGRVTLDGRNISKQPARKRAQSGLALVPQGLDLARHVIDFAPVNFVSIISKDCNKVFCPPPCSYFHINIFMLSSL